MFTELNSQLSEAHQAQRQRDKLRADLLRAQDDLKKEQARLAELQAISDREDQDVRRLEGLSMTALFYTVLGSKDEQLQKERQEYLSAHLKLRQSQYAVEALEGDVEHMKSRLARFGDVDARLQALLEKKEALLAKAGDETARRLSQLSEQLGEAQSQLREVAEAIAAGQEAHQAVNQVLQNLKSAQGWGAWDMLGGGLLATAVKHNRIDDARKAAYEVQEALRRFQRELADVEQSAKFIVEDISSFETFADFFFDGLIIDWVVQAHIDRSLDNTRATAGRLDDLLAQLEKHAATLQEQINHLEEDKRSLVESAA
jgi:chromosome segregation ATPase